MLSVSYVKPQANTYTIIYVKLALTSAVINQVDEVYGATLMILQRLSGDRKLVGLAIHHKESTKAKRQLWYDRLTMKVPLCYWLEVTGSYEQLMVLIESTKMMACERDHNDWGLRDKTIDVSMQ